MSDLAVEMIGCEACQNETPVETATIMEDCWYCPACVRLFQEAFRTCEHEWQPHVDVMGEAGRYCTRCAGFVRDEDFSDMFPAPTKEG